ncbi:hypothetical protein P9B03_15390 [Metasolibacillus meyeri]|uniref:BclA C-terminal domain-containing protein n=1 Tax=Metasolibacillus meyeri TaxID=1071052 RepID=A0AAW9NXK2_9BACL|nr:hypothetical protein [Metasolibacillus meyeri]MEC1179883.1 hypothetical protein [Metasolibacillus meyeri]
MSFKDANGHCHSNKCHVTESKYLARFVATQGPIIPPPERVLSFGSLRGDTVTDTTPVMTPVPFSVAGPLSKVTVSPTGNELVVSESGVYQVTLSINAIAFAAPDPGQNYLTASITVNGAPIFTQGLAVFNITSRNSSTFVVQAALNAGDSVGASATSDDPIFGYLNRSLTILQLN